MKLAKRLAESLGQFLPERPAQFLCPTCLADVSLADHDRISEAHIVPRAAGGMLTTLLCRPCNSTFGARQDSWFGEYARLALERKGFEHIKRRQQSGSFEVDGLRLGGWFQPGRAGGIEFIFRDDLVSPASREDLQRRPLRSRSKITISAKIPFLANEKLIALGFLTAAYLLYFRQLGYSWVLQRHLDIVRQQIRNPTVDLLAGKFSARIEGEPFAKPWLGMGHIGGEFALLAGLVDHVIFLPPADRPDFYKALPRDLRGIKLSLRRTWPHEQHSAHPPAGIFVGDRLVVAPDVFMETPQSALLFLPGRETEPVWLRAVSAATFARTEQLPSAMRVSKISEGSPVYLVDVATADTLETTGRD